MDAKHHEMEWEASWKFSKRLKEILLLNERLFLIIKVEENGDFESERWKVNLNFGLKIPISTTTIHEANFLKTTD